MHKKNEIIESLISKLFSMVGLGLTCLVPELLIYVLIYIHIYIHIYIYLYTYTLVLKKIYS